MSALRAFRRAVALRMELARLRIARGSPAWEESELAMEAIDLFRNLALDLAAEHGEPGYPIALAAEVAEHEALAFGEVMHAAP